MTVGALENMERGWYIASPAWQTYRTRGTIFNQPCDIVIIVIQWHVLGSEYRGIRVVCVTLCACRKHKTEQEIRMIPFM